MCLTGDKEDRNRIEGIQNMTKIKTSTVTTLKLYFINSRFMK